MDAQTCLNKLRYVGVLSFATVDGEGNPQVRNISAIHYEPDALYFFTARGKDFCKEQDARLATDVNGNTVYLATSIYNLETTMKHWPQVVFHTTREMQQTFD